MNRDKNLRKEKKRRKEKEIERRIEKKKEIKRRIRERRKEKGKRRDKIRKFADENHKIHHKIEKAREEIERTNKEYKDLENKAQTIKIRTTVQTRLRRSDKIIMTAIWLVILMIYISLIMTNVGLHLHGDKLHNKIDISVSEDKTVQHNEEVQVIRNYEHETNNDASKKAEQEKKKKNREKKYYGVLLTGFAPVEYEYYPNDEAVIETIIELKDPDKINATAEYEMYDPEQKKIYTYSDKVKIDSKNNILRKKILLTDNYKPGRYRVRFRLRFKVNNKRYLLTGMTDFELKERPKEKILAKLGRTGLILKPIHYILLTIILLLNFALVYNTWKTDIKNSIRKKKKEEE